MHNRSPEGHWPSEEWHHWAATEYAAIVTSGDGGVRRCLFVAEVEGRVIGFAVGKVIGVGAECSAELESVAVDATVRRLGLGRALCEAVVEWWRGYYRDPADDALLMRLELGNCGERALPVPSGVW